MCDWHVYNKLLLTYLLTYCKCYFTPIWYGLFDTWFVRLARDHSRLQAVALLRNNVWHSLQSRSLHRGAKNCNIFIFFCNNFVKFVYYAEIITGTCTVRQICYNTTSNHWSLLKHIFTVNCDIQHIMCTCSLPTSNKLKLIIVVSNI